jgi:hypothetical protein
MNHSEYCAQSSEFLISGPDVLTVSSIVSSADDLISKSKELKQKHATHQKHLLELNNKVVNYQNKIQQQNIIEKYKNYNLMINEEQFLTMAMNIRELEDNTDIIQYPILVCKILQNSPKVIPKNSKIFSMLCRVTDDIRKSLLSEFHNRFESHLIRSEELLSSDESWSEFLSSTRVWLVSYTMVTILPGALQDKETSHLLDDYKDSLDSALTPMWGRFYFHLSTARESASIEQLAWTFEYCKSFVNLLCSLCSHITTSTELQEVCNGDFYKVSLAQITEKAIRFMIAHVSSALVAHSPLPEGLCIMILENCLELDDYLSQIHAPPAGLHISNVLCENNAILEEWVKFDRNFFFTILHDLCTPNNSSKRMCAISEFNKLNSCFNTYFDSMQCPTYIGESLPEFDESNDNNSISESIQKNINGIGRLRCFCSVYDALSTFEMACKRYNCLPTVLHELFSCVMLEPILLTIAGILMYYSYNSPVLKEIRRKHIPFYLTKDELPNDEINMLFDTGKYTQLTLDRIRLPNHNFAACNIHGPNRFESNLLLLTSYIEDMQRTKSDDFDLASIVKKIDKLTVHSTDKIAYNGSHLESNAASGGFKTVLDVMHTHVFEIFSDVNFHLKNLS